MVGSVVDSGGILHINVYINVGGTVFLVNVFKTRENISLGFSRK